MGADLYLKTISDKNRQEWEGQFYEACRARDKA